MGLEGLELRLLHGFSSLLEHIQLTSKLFCIQLGIFFHLSCDQIRPLSGLVVHQFLNACIINDVFFPARNKLVTLTSFRCYRITLTIPELKKDAQTFGRILDFARVSKKLIKPCLRRYPKMLPNPKDFHRFY